MDYALLLDRLVPTPQYGGVPNTPTFQWNDVRPEPTEIELADEHVVFLAEEAIKANNVSAYNTYNAAIHSGYTHTDGYVYYCNERATTDMVKVITLFDLDPAEPVIVITLNGTIRELTYAAFELLAKAIGNHQYSLRKAYWASLQK